jgi:hypothetical protein
MVCGLKIPSGGELRQKTEPSLAPARITEGETVGQPFRPHLPERGLAEKPATRNGVIGSAIVTASIDFAVLS